MFTKTTLLVIFSTLFVLFSATSALRVDLSLNEQTSINSQLSQFLLPLDLSVYADSSISLTLTRSSSLVSVANIYVGINAAPEHSSNADYFSLCTSLNVLGLLSVDECVLTLPPYLLNELKRDINVNLFIDVVTNLDISLLSLSAPLQLTVSPLDLTLDAEVSALTNLRIANGANLFAVVNVPAGSILNSITLVKTSGSLLSGSVNSLSSLRVRLAADVDTILDANVDLDLSLTAGQSIFTLNLPVELSLNKRDINVGTTFYIGLFVDSSINAIVNLSVDISLATSIDISASIAASASIGASVDTSTSIAASS